jgi:hypothetical protein
LLGTTQTSQRNFSYWYNYKLLNGRPIIRLNGLSTHAVHRGGDGESCRKTERETTSGGENEVGCYEKIRQVLSRDVPCQLVVVASGVSVFEYDAVDQCYPGKLKRSTTEVMGFEWMRRLRAK